MSRSIDNPLDFRRAALDNGYRLLRVEARGKKPIARGWKDGEAPDVLLRAGDQSNTGLVLDGLGAIDFDIDDAALSEQIVSAAKSHLPKNAILRYRPHSLRFALIYRAAHDQLKKRSVRKGRNGIDILGAGCQIVVDGIHPSGERLCWKKDRSPATVPQNELPTVTESQIESFLDAVSPLLGLAGQLTSQVTPLAKVAPNISAAAANSELSAGIEAPRWFDALPPDEKQQVIKASLDAIDNQTSDPRDTWLTVLFALADAGHKGCPDARDLALSWSQRGASWTSEADFDAVWDSFKPGKITVATILHLARAAGADLSPWYNLVLPGSAVPVAATGYSAPPGALPISALPIVPPKREWLHGSDLARGAVSLLIAPGARGKSSWLTTLALATAAGQPLLGSHVFGGQLRTLYLNSEDALNELALKFRAAMTHHGLTEDDVPGLMVAGADTCKFPLLDSDRGVPRLNAPGWDAFVSEIEHSAPDVIIMDPLVAFTGGTSLNDNAAAALLMGKLVQIAAQRRCAIMVAHHASKGRDITSAEAAMGAASLVNLARIALALEPLAKADASKVGLMPDAASSVFRVVGTKQNLSPPDATDRWYRLVSVEMPNAAPPIYLHGDRVGVVEKFTPNPADPVIPSAVIQAALKAISNAPTPLSPSPRSKISYAIPVIAAAVAPHQGGRLSEVNAKAVLDHLIRTGQVVEQNIKVLRGGGRGPSSRIGLMVVAPTSGSTT